MKYAIIENGKVSNIIEWDGASPLGDLAPVAIPEDTPHVGIGTAYDGTEFEPLPPPVVPPLSAAECEAALGLSLDQGAQSWGYDGIVSAASYAASTVAKFKAEADALIGWRDASWMWAESLLASLTTEGSNPPADVTAFLAAAPAMPARPTAS